MWLLLSAIDSYQEVDSKSKTGLQEVYLVVSLGTKPLIKWRKPNWTEGEIKLWGSVNRMPNQLYGEFWRWNGSLEVSCLKLQWQAFVLWHSLDVCWPWGGVLTWVMDSFHHRATCREENATRSWENWSYNPKRGSGHTAAFIHLTVIIINLWKNWKVQYQVTFYNYFKNYSVNCIIYPILKNLFCK